jgi:uncharacterized protein YceK
MKKLLLLMITAFLLSSCATVGKFAETSQKAIVEVQDQHTAQEWATFYDVLSTIAGKGAEIAFTSTGQNVFTSLSETAGDRAESWKAKVP